MGKQFNAGRIHGVPIEHGTGGHYQLAMRSGTLPALLAANSVLFSLRTGSSSKLVVLLALQAYFQTLTAFTAHQELSLEAFVGRAFTASHTGGTAATLTGNNLKARTLMPSVSIADARISSTAALGGGTLVLDAHPFAVALGSPNIVNSVAGTAYAPYNRSALEYRPDPSIGEHPLVLAPEEGVVIRNAQAFPATGTGVLAVMARWAEVDSYPDVS